MPSPARKARPQYTALVLFGKETQRSVASPDTFRTLADDLAGLLRLATPDLKARGWIEGDKGKKFEPRKGKWSDALRDKWLDALPLGDFRNFELFDAKWANDRYPDAYGAFYKHWDWGPDGRTERTDDGVENSITLALRDECVPDALGRIKDAARRLIPVIDCFYGTIEAPIPWDQEFGSGYTDMIDVRFHDRVNNDYGNGTRHMADGVPRLYRGNLFSRSQLAKNDPAALRKLPGVTAVESWPGGLTYVELTEQPAYQSKTPPRFADFIRFIPDGDG